MRRRARRLAAVTAVSGLATGVHAAVARAGTDVWGNVGPASPLRSGGLFGRYPLGHYALDQHFSAVSASITGGVDVSGLLPMIAYFFASLAWLVTSFGAKILIELFAFAFSLDLVGGSEATGGVGALGPVSAAIHSIYADVLGGPWLVLTVSVVGLWAMWRALVQRRYSETAGALALSLIYVVVALFFVAEPGQTIAQASRWTNAMSQAFLSISAHGDPSGGTEATADDSDQLWDLLVYKPWSVLEFGGLEHCVVAGTGDKDSDPRSAPVRPLSHDPDEAAALARRLSSGTEVSADGKACINNADKYASHFLRFGPGTDERGDEYDALNHGDAEKLPEADDEAAAYKLGVADKPATDAMEEGGQYQRLLIAIVVMVGEAGALLLLGSLAIGIILAQVLLLLLLAFSPVALIAAAIPGRGHDFFKAWLAKLAGYLLRKAAYSLVLAVLLAVNGALASATSELGWLFSFGLQALFFWAVFLQRHKLTEGIVGVVTGPSVPGRDKALGALALYSGARTVVGPLRGVGRQAGRMNSRSRRGGSLAPAPAEASVPVSGPPPSPAVVDPPASAPIATSSSKPTTASSKPASRAAAESASSTPAEAGGPHAIGKKTAGDGSGRAEGDPFKREAVRRADERDAAESRRPVRRPDHTDRPESPDHIDRPEDRRRGEESRGTGRDPRAAHRRPVSAGKGIPEEPDRPHHRSPRQDGPDQPMTGDSPGSGDADDLAAELRADRERARGGKPERPRPTVDDDQPADPAGSRAGDNLPASSRPQRGPRVRRPGQ